MYKAQTQSHFFWRYNRYKDEGKTKERKNVSRRSDFLSRDWTVYNMRALAWATREKAEVNRSTMRSKLRELLHARYLALSWQQGSNKRDTRSRYWGSRGRSCSAHARIINARLVRFSRSFPETR